MKSTVLLLALYCASTLAADRPAASQAITNPQSAIDNRQSTIVNGLDAITIPQMLSYQGKLTDTLGVPVPSGNYQLTFRLYTQPTGGSAIWTEAQTIMVKGGLFSALLGAVTPIGAVPDGGSLYLGLQVAIDPELSPRLRIGSAAYAYLSSRAADADMLQGKDTTGFVRSGQVNSVTSAMLVDGTVASADIADTNVTMSKIARAGAATGHVVKWTGSAWAPGQDNTGGGSGVTDIYQDTGIICVPNPITSSGNVSLDLSYGDGRYVNESQANSISGAMITDGNVTSADIRDTTVNSAELKDNAVTSAKILDGTVTSADIRDTTVNTGDLKDAAVTMAKLNQAGATSGQVIKWTGSAWAPRNDSVSGVVDSMPGSFAVSTDLRVYGCARIGSNLTQSGTNSIVFGSQCTVAGNRSSVLGGWQNSVDGNDATVGGGAYNYAGSHLAFVGGGQYDSAKARYGAVSGGYHNLAGDSVIDTCATVAGGYYNSATGRFATVGGGTRNKASGQYDVVGGGCNDTASGYYSVVSGGLRNTASGASSTVSGGADNEASDDGAAIGGGYSNVASGFGAVVGGGEGNSATSKDATVPGGYVCEASRAFSFAAGCHAKARGDGSFVWSDSCGAADSVRNTTDNRWVARARGGVYFYTSLDKSTGSYLSAGGSSWNSVSDSMTKENFRAVDKKALLETLARMRVRDYNLKSQDPSIRHIGPVAQDFHNSFGFGESNTAINMEDADGVLLAAVQALYEQNRAQQAEIEELKVEIAKRK